MKITVYEKNDCMQCKQTKRLLDKLEISYDTVNIEDDETALQYVKELGYLAAPVILVTDGTNTKHWSGFIPDNIKGLKK